MNEKVYGEGSSNASSTPFASSCAPIPPSAKCVASNARTPSAPTSSTTFAPSTSVSVGKRLTATMQGMP